MKFELNINDEYKNINNIDEWGCAFVFHDGNGVEYNYCRENNEDYSAIYYFTYDEINGHINTNYNAFVRYKIDFKDINWKSELKNTMEKVLNNFEKCLTNNIKYDIV